MSDADIVVPLSKSFRFAHEPLTTESADRFIGRLGDLDSLVQRLLYSDGGSFLITGYRGVGKSSFVNQVIGKLEAARPQAEAELENVELKILHVSLNLARRLEPAALMHHIIRRLYETLGEEGIFGELPEDLQHDLAQAYDRTSFNMTRKLGDTFERNISLPDLNIDSGAAKFGIKSIFSTKRSLSRNDELSFLSYDDHAAEHDIIRLSRRLSRGFKRRGSSRWWMHPSAANRARRELRFKIIFVFDELDKLDDELPTRSAGDVTEDAKPLQSTIEELLSFLKTLFTTSGISFLFVAGKDLQERWLEDVGRGDSVFESVFSYHKYLACMWADVDGLCDGLVDWEAVREGTESRIRIVRCANCGVRNQGSVAECPNCGEDLSDQTIPARPNSCSNCWSPLPAGEAFCRSCGAYVQEQHVAEKQFADFKKYLAYAGRGIPRLITQAFNNHVRWHNNRPIVTINRADARRVRFYARLQQLLEDESARLFGSEREDLDNTLLDRRRLAVYYLVDWIIRRGTFEFTFGDAVAESARLSRKIAPSAEVASRVIRALIDVLVEKDYLLKQAPGPDRAQVGDPVKAVAETYRLSPRRLAELGEQTNRVVPPAPGSGTAEFTLISPPASAPSGAAPGGLSGPYELLDVIGRGGMGTVYRALDARTGRIVALKIIERFYASDPAFAARFRREADVLKTLLHPGIVRYYESGELDGQLFIAMDLVEGPNIQQILSATTRLDVGSALAIAQQVAETGEYIHTQGVVRLDVKPSNILLRPTGRVCLVDFGIAKPTTMDQDMTVVAGPIGTPAYMAPEQIQGLAVDARTDVYALGVVLYEMLTGQRPFQSDGSLELFFAIINNPPPPLSGLVEVPAELEAIVMRCLSKEPDQRYASMAELGQAIGTLLSAYPLHDLSALVAQTTASLQRTSSRRNVATVTALISPDDLELTRLGEPVDGALATDAADHSGPYLRVLAGPDQVGTTFSLATGPAMVHIGRATENEIVLSSSNVSRYHAIVTRAADGTCRIEDLNSKTGTLVNGVLIHSSTVLEPNSRIVIVDYQLGFVSTDPEVPGPYGAPALPQLSTVVSLPSAV